MNSHDAFRKICPIFLSAVTIAKMCDTGKMQLEDSIRDEDSNNIREIFSLIQINKNTKGDRIVCYDPTCQAGYCAMWQWDDKKSDEGHCGLTDGRNK